MVGTSVNNNSSSPTNTTRYYKDESGTVTTSTSETIIMVFDSAPSSNKPTNVQDNSLLIEKDTARRYWFSKESETSSSQTSTNDARSLKAGNRNKIGQQFNTDHVLVGQAPTKATFYLSKGGSPPNNVTAYIRNSSGTLRETSTTTIVANNLTGSAVATDFTFAGTTTLATGDMITVEYNSGDNTHYVNAWTNNLSAVTNSVLRGYTSSWSDISGEALKFIVYYTPATWTKQQPQLPTVSGLYVHYDATDVDSITKDSNNRISQWNDKSGGARHLTQATSGNQPLWIESDQVGNPVIDFVGDRYMSDTWSAQSLPNTIFIVTVMPTATGSRTNIISGSGSNAQSVFGDGSNTWKYAAGSAQGGTKSGIEGTWQDIYALYGDDYTFEINGDLVSGANCGSDTWAGMEVGASSGSQFGNMKIGEIIGYNTAIKGTDKTTILDYLKAKWGLS